MKPTKFASAPSLKGICECIVAFYCGSQKELKQFDPSTWELINKDGTTIRGVVVRLRGGRYTLESR